jgi:hypothetical protein
MPPDTFTRPLNISGESEHAAGTATRPMGLYQRCFTSRWELVLVKPSGDCI